MVTDILGTVIFCKIQNNPTKTRELTIYRSDGYGGKEHVELDIDVIRTTTESIHYRPKSCNK